MTVSSPVTAKKSMRILSNPRSVAVSMTFLNTHSTSLTETRPVAVASKKSSTDASVSCISSMIFLVGRHLLSPQNVGRVAMRLGTPELDDVIRLSSRWRAASVGRGSDHTPTAGAEDRLCVEEPTNQCNYDSRFSHGLSATQLDSVMRKRSGGIYSLALVPGRKHSWVGRAVQKMNRAVASRIGSVQREGCVCTA